MEKYSGYARAVAYTRVEQEQNKRILGKPYLKLGQCHSLWAYSFQLGGILSAKHHANPDAFGHVFLGASGDPGAIKNFFKKIAQELVAPSVNESMTFGHYVNQDFARQVGYEGDPQHYFLGHMGDKVPTELALELACIYCGQGAALGSTYPQMFQKMFDCTHTSVPSEEWKQAHKAGLNIPAEQDVMSYKEIEEEEDEFFMAYCKEFCPGLFAILAGQP